MFRCEKCGRVTKIIFVDSATHESLCGRCNTTKYNKIVKKKQWKISKKAPEE